MTAAEVAAKIGQGREKFAQGKWSVPCTGHDDHNPSLDISEGTNGVVMICHAGCDTADVLAAAGLTWGDLFSDEPRTTSRDDDDTWTPAGRRSRDLSLHRQSGQADFRGTADR